MALDIAVLGWTREDMVLYAKELCPSYPLDIGIVRAVRILREAHLTTVESCQGGRGHAYPEPTVKFSGDPAAGWKAVSVLMARGLPIADLRQAWTFEYNRPNGPFWEVTFSRRLD